MQYPLQLRFKLIAIASQIYVSDASGQVVFFVKQKLFKLKEDITVFGDEAQREPLYTIKADRIIDFSANYVFTDAQGRAMGAIKRQGMKSLWKSHYDIKDGTGRAALTLSEENPWVKVVEGLVSNIPVVGFVFDYLLNPTFVITGADGEPALRLVKKPSLFERRFEIEKLVPLAPDDEVRALLGVLMMVLLERERG